MKNRLSFFAILSIVTFFTACNVNDSYYEDYTPPAPPTGIQVLNGDERVDIFWNHNRESDLAGYNVYYSYSYNGRYTLIGSTANNYFIDFGANNGERYYYAVTAYDYNGNESDLSHDVVYAVPRPEGFNQTIFDYRRFPNNAGYSFANYSVVRYDDQNSDVFFENYQGTYYLVVWDDTDIQDMGSTSDIYDIPYAPSSGWSPSKDVIARVGHTYVIWTWNNHYAKIRVKNITPDRVVFDWAYQLVKGEPMLKPSVKGGIRKQINKSTLERE